MYGSKIQAIRNARGYTQDYMAKMLDMEQTSYSKIEKNNSGKMDDSLLEKVAKALGVNTEDIKSSTPIVMNFHHSRNSQATTFDTQHNQSSPELVEELRQQLKVKDSQIDKLMQIIGQKPTT